MRTTLEARWVVPIDAPPIPDGAVVLDGDTIEWVGAARHAPPTPHTESLGEVVLLPGLVNVHAHLDLTVLRGFLERLDFREWIRTLTAARAQLTTDEFEASAIVGVAEGLSAGITTFADTAPTDAALQAMGRMGVRGIAYLEVFGPDPAHARDAVTELSQRVDAARRALPPRVRVGVSPHAPYSVSAALFARTAHYARTEQLPVAVHIAESEDESRLVQHGDGRWAEFLRGRGLSVAPLARSSIALLDATDVLATRPLLIHAVRIDEQDAHRIAAHGASIAHCPVSNAKLGHGIAPLDVMLASDIAVGLGSDSVASNNQMDLLTEARTAVLMQCVRRARADALTGRDALYLATLGGARALGWDDRIGSLTPGKAADLVAFPLDDLRSCPTAGPEDALIFAMPGARAREVWVDGVRLVQGGVHPRVGEATTVVQAAADRLQLWRATRDP
ncbi:MAG: amidohydrolase family protein [Gemmatimonadaceae bacterium]|nr:amidohydrolase family protein [Gemmatimonadaceae bacterium]